MLSSAHTVAYGNRCFEPSRGFETIRDSSHKQSLFDRFDGTAVRCVHYVRVDPLVLANLARGRLRHKLPDLQRALQGRFRPHHAFLVEQILAKIDFLDETVDRVTAEIDRRLGSFEPMLAALDTIPGIDRIGAISIVAETGGHEPVSLRRPLV